MHCNNWFPICSRAPVQIKLALGELYWIERTEMLLEIVRDVETEIGQLCVHP
jgi:hypothetical protein